MQQVIPSVKSYFTLDFAGKQDNAQGECIIILNRIFAGWSALPEFAHTALKTLLPFPAT
jgi:hypothetical protein